MSATSIKRIFIFFPICFSNSLFAANGDDCPWIPDSGNHHATANIGSTALPPNTVGPPAPLEIYIDYTVSWQARKCGTKPIEYQSLKWAVGKKPQNVQIPTGSTLAMSAWRSFPAVNQAIPNGSTWTIWNIGSTIEAADKMELDVEINWGNHTSPPAGAVCGADPQIATISGPSEKLIFTDSGHGLFFHIDYVVNGTPGRYVYPGYTAAKAFSISNPQPATPAP